MGLTMGSGPFGQHPTGTHNAAVQDGFVLVDPFPRRVRAVRGGMVVIDSDAVSLVHVTGSLPRYSFPQASVDMDAEPDKYVDGNVTVPWGGVDAWFEEDERVFVHPRDPYHRIDSFLSSRRVDIRAGDAGLASSARAHMLCETGLPVRWYLPRADVSFEYLELSNSVTECPYKGTAHYWSFRTDDGVLTDVAWSYEDDVRREGAPVQWLICFDDSQVQVLVDGRGRGR